jgi:hypothetical protein
MATPAGFENNPDDATISDDSLISVGERDSLAEPDDVSRNVTVPSLGTVTETAFEALEDAIRTGDTVRALELAALLRGATRCVCY